MERKVLLFLTGMSGSGKGYFWENYLKPLGKFRKLVSATTRKPREGEAEGRDYYFRDERFFDTEEFAAKLFVNRQFWKPGEPKWLYGVEKREILRNGDKNLVYDVIEPKYVRQMIDWCDENGRRYDFRIAYFLNPAADLSCAEKRRNMPNDISVRTENTCNPIDFLRAGLHPDWFMLCSSDGEIFDKRMMDFISKTR
ncbi:MAG: hypothetical protein LBT45_00505 [Rickettsiales bacterium]|nr:hypothetical protein [Rickettsiales bacterium]